MILIIGARGSGKRAYTQKLGYAEADIERATVVANAQELVRPEDSDPVLIANDLASAARVVLCDEVGSGIVPIDPSERAWRERAGRLSCELAERADSVVRMVCGIPTALKGPPPRTERPVRLVIMRHGSTQANEQHTYAGFTDVALSGQGEQQARDAGTIDCVERVYVSPLQRARRTAELCFPNAKQHVIEGLQEMNFGAFEGRSAADMEHDPDYRAWVDGMCEGICPGGESRAMLDERVNKALVSIMREAIAHGNENAIVVGHNGTVMAAMDALAEGEKGYFDWHVGNCEGYHMDAFFEGGKLRITNWQHFTDLQFLNKCYEEVGDQQQLPAHSFISNKACKYFPCHEGIAEEDFNCLFCYCPLYALGPNCGGNFTYTESGRKNCTSCTLPHERDNGTKLVQAHYEQLAKLATRNRSNE